MARNAVGWFEIYVQDMTRAKKFYQAVFKTKLQNLGNRKMPMWAFPMNPKAPGTPGALMKAEGVPSGGNSTLVYFNCDDCAVEAGRVAKAGGKVYREKMSIGQYGFVALAFDTEGNMFGLHSRK